MKTLVLTILIPVYLLAQPSYPDTLFMRQGKTFPCLVTAINDFSINVIYANYAPNTVVMDAINQLSIEGHNIVYKYETGFISNTDNLKSFIADRNERIRNNKPSGDIEIVSAFKMNDSLKQSDFYAEPSEIIDTTLNRWSFGIIYVPYFSGRIYYLRYDLYDQIPQLSSYSNSETNMETQLAYFVGEKFGLTFNLGYSAVSTEDRTEAHTRNNQQVPPYTQNSGNINSNSLSLLSLSLGMKYQFNNVLDEKVSAFILAGIGKQIAFSTIKNEVLFNPPNPNNTYSQDNQEEYTEDINSPLQINLGFGAEYYFNRSLSLFSSIRFIYSTSSGKYEYRSVSDTQDYSFARDYSRSDLITRVGLGINFYF